MSKPINIDEASEYTLEDTNTTEKIKCYLHRLDGVTSLKLYYGCQLGNLLENKGLITTTLSLLFIQRNYAVIKQICDSNQDNFI